MRPWNFCKMAAGDCRVRLPRDFRAVEQHGVAQSDIGNGKPHPPQAGVGLRQLADAYIGFAPRNEIDDCIEGVGVFNERYADAESRPICCANSISAPTSVPSRPRVEARQVKSGNGHAQNLGFYDRLEVASGVPGRGSPRAEQRCRQCGEDGKASETDSLSSRSLPQLSCLPTLHAQAPECQAS